MRQPDFSDVAGRHVLAALSGGADSTALLSLLCRARDSGILTLSAAHFEHGIRGEESRADAEFCENLCRKWDIPYYMGRADVPEIARRTRAGIETTARKLRYDFLREIKQIIGADMIAPAHHADDQAETVLMHILRGAGPDGVSGMRKISGDIYRPLIAWRKSEILEYLSENKLEWREDSTNSVSDNPRNRLRNDILPALERVYPGAASALARYANYAAIEGDFVKKLADKWRAENEIALPHARALDIKTADEALLRRAVRAIVGKDLTGAKLDEIIKSAAPTDIVNGMRAERHGDRLYILTKFEPPPPAYLNLSGETKLPGICRVTCSPCENRPERTLKSAQNLARAALEGACLRTRRAGDRLTPLGMTGGKSLSDYFTDKKIDPPLRDIIPLVARGGEILWVVGVGISEKAKLDGKDAIRLVCEYDGWGGPD